MSAPPSAPNEFSDLPTTQTQASDGSTLQWSMSDHQHVCICYSQEYITQASKENLKWKKFLT